MLLKTKTKDLELPLFFPDATHAFIKGVGSDDLKANKVRGLVVNTYHNLINGYLPLISSFGGLHKFMNFDYPIITDSGGFQAMSLVRRNPKNGRITDNGVIFKLEGTHKKIELTPELCIETQLQMGSDIIMCLDDCTEAGESLEEQVCSVERTIAWAQRCKDHFNSLTKGKKKKPRIFGIVQGGNNKKLRKLCADELIKIGFDGFAFGGWPVDENGKFLTTIVKYTASVMPDDLPKYAMGVGKPEDIMKCVKMGYNLFDCVLPTRDARHKRLYVFNGNDITKKSAFKYVYIGSGKYAHDTKPISDQCECTTCKNYSRGYLNHLFKKQDSLAIRLATIHNLRFYSDLMEKIKKLK